MTFVWSVPFQFSYPRAVVISGANSTTEDVGTSSHGFIA